MITDNSLGVYRNGSFVNNTSLTNLDILSEFLKEAELQHYFDDLNLKLKVRSTAQLKYVDETDLQSIGMTRPEMKRLKKYFTKEFPQSAMGKLKKRLSRTTSARSTSIPRPHYLSNRMNSFTTRFSANGQLISPISSDDLMTITSGTNVSIASNTPDSYDLKQFNCKYLIPHNHMTLGSLLKHGDFADIYEANLLLSDVSIKVVVKIINVVSLKNDIHDFLKEMFSYCNLDHDNIIKMYGLYLEEYCIKVITELSSLGSLVDCLMKVNSKTLFPITVLHNMTVQISDGMRYLEEKGVVHGRLTTRNVLVFPDNMIKITDIGLFRANSSLERCDIGDTTLRLSPEVLKGNKKTIFSDVWSFGFLLWDIYSYCKHFHSIDMEESVSSLIDIKLRFLSQPELCPNMIFHLMKMCWSYLITDRPSFYQLFTELVRLEPEKVVALVDGTDMFPSLRTEEVNITNDDSYSSLSEMQMLYYKTDDVIIVIDRSMSQYKDLWRGCLLTGECGFFKWSNMRAMVVTDDLETFKIKINEDIPASSITSNDCHVSQTLSKVYKSRREDKKMQGRLTVDMISSPQNDFRHVAHVGVCGDVFGDINSLYRNSSQNKDKEVLGSASFCFKNSDDNNLILSNTLIVATEGTPPYATIDRVPSTAISNKSKEMTKKMLKKDVKSTTAVQSAPPLPPFLSCAESVSLFDELAKRWEIEYSKLGSPAFERKLPLCITDESNPLNSGSLKEDYEELFDDYQINKISTGLCLEKSESIIKKAQRTERLIESNPSKTNIFQKFYDLGVNKSSNNKDLSEQKLPIYARINKSKKSEDEVKVSEAKTIISNPNLTYGHKLVSIVGLGESYWDCSSEVSSLQASPRNSVLCMTNTGSYSHGVTDLRTNTQVSENVTRFKKKTNDSTITSVSASSSLASLTSASMIQSGAAAQAFSTKYGVFRAGSVINGKIAPLDQIQLTQYWHDLNSSRTSDTMSQSVVESHRSSITKADKYENLDELLNSYASTPIASDSPDIPYIDLSFVGMVITEKIKLCEDEDAYNSLYSGSLGSDEYSSRVNLTDLNGRSKSSPVDKQTNVNIFSMNYDKDEVAL